MRKVASRSLHFPHFPGLRIPWFARFYGRVSKNLRDSFFQNF